MRCVTRRHAGGKPRAQALAALLRRYELADYDVVKRERSRVWQQCVTAPVAVTAPWTELVPDVSGVNDRRPLRCFFHSFVDHSAREAQPARSQQAVAADRLRRRLNGRTLDAKQETS
jgi:hypothetical protein